MNILILNWRDIKNPRSGGAEILTHEVAKRWIKLGHKVTLFSSTFPNSKKEEMIDGVKFVRGGHPDARFLLSSVHFLAYKFYRKNPGKFDAVIDEVHGLPFFTPWYVKEKKVVLICEVAGDLWVKMFGPFFGLFGRLIEHLYLRFIYKNIPYLTISISTQDELLKEGIKNKYITVLPMGITVPKEIKKIEKEKDPTLIFVGRLSKSKGIEDAIEALSQVLKINTKIKFWIVGGGDEDYVRFLKKKAKNLNVLDRISFWGYVSEEKKFELMGRAHILLAPSLKEGWGLTVPEAGFMGTPAIGYNVPGLREVIKDNKTGYLTLRNNPSELAKSIDKSLKKESEYERLGRAAKNMSLSYNWDNTAQAMLDSLKKP